MAELLKPLVLFLIVYLAWKILKAVAQGAALNARRGNAPGVGAGRPGGARFGWGNAGMPPGASQAAPTPVGRVEDLVQCHVCSTYIASRGAGRCGREDCPQGRR